MAEGKQYKVILTALHVAFIHIAVGQCQIDFPVLTPHSRAFTARSQTSRFHLPQHLPHVDTLFIITALSVLALGFMLLRF